MYSKTAFKDRVGHKKRDFFHGTRDHVGVRKKSGEYSYRPFGGFVESVVRYPVKVRVEGVTYDYPNYEDARGHLLGTWQAGTIYVLVPFKIV
jgi:hypothetical protein